MTDKVDISKWIEDFKSHQHTFDETYNWLIILSKTKDTSEEDAEKYQYLVEKLKVMRDSFLKEFSKQLTIEKYNEIHAKTDREHLYFNECLIKEFGSRKLPEDPDAMQEFKIKYKLEQKLTKEQLIVELYVISTPFEEIKNYESN